MTRRWVEVVDSQTEPTRDRDAALNSTRQKLLSILPQPEFSRHVPPTALAYTIATCPGAGGLLRRSGLGRRYWPSGRRPGNRRSHRSRGRRRWRVLVIQVDDVFGDVDSIGSVEHRR